MPKMGLENAIMWVAYDRLFPYSPSFYDLIKWIQEHLTTHTRHLNNINIY